MYALFMQDKCLYKVSSLNETKTAQLKTKELKENVLKSMGKYLWLFVN